MKETKEILDHILRMKKSEYDMLDSSGSFSKPAQSDQKESETNVLQDEAEDKEETLDDMESYETTQEMDFEVDEIKDCLEKKKKRRNYIEFRSDYEKE